ncbi:endonuclease-8 [Microbacteriaceae bacterium SG_E_30_P1]|uniref:DNA-(apurinic or apyrimidinic site) lyase n=1 Tax=Antiquaquibacter oligotrophicus TaxID=2880260 RepID=A0ABT6KLQ3_9MICO|nr:DNA-formamidopyrimidine glycosylase family protein [Antiquaquibacter oligotrophicus]MDH6180948.1 endonuclease-8 [Antiquaquibacter oligotrophicus]UDF13350.1 Fpg/Nei family DNA glycosylase [Antiquaquibacter oligotrophicus]
MPEGDTVYRSAHALNAALAGTVLTRCDIRVPKFATTDLTGSPVHEVIPRGKHLLMRVGEYTLHSHLKMEGSWHLYRHDTRWQRPAWQARAILETESVVAVGFELGLFEVIRTSDEDEAVGYLGPDLLGPDWDPDTALANLRAAPEREIGLAVLDQRVLAGLGNVYRAELCFLRGVLPTRPVGDVNDLERMVDLAHRLILANRDRVERTTTGNLQRDRTWVYGRGGRPCLRCGTRIMVGELGDSPTMLRTVWWCPRCQR